MVADDLLVDRVIQQHLLAAAVANDLLINR